MAAFTIWRDTFANDFVMPFLTAGGAVLFICGFRIGSWKDHLGRSYFQRIQFLRFLDSELHVPEGGSGSI